MWFMVEFLSQFLSLRRRLSRGSRYFERLWNPKALCKHRHFDITVFSCNSFDLSWKIFYRRYQRTQPPLGDRWRLCTIERQCQKVEAALWHFNWSDDERSCDNTRLLHVDWLKPMSHESRSKKASTAFTGISFPATASSLGLTLVPHLHQNTSWCVVSYFPFLSSLNYYVAAKLSYSE